VLGERERTIEDALNEAKKARDRVRGHEGPERGADARRPRRA
jgi:hypothetical protein